MKQPTYCVRLCTIAEVRELCERWHGYGSAGSVAVYAFGVYEDGRLVAGYLWQPPPPGAARSVCPEAPEAVLALSRMVAVPKAERRLNHVSKPLRRQMRTLIDRQRWPVLVTYSDEGQGHTGHVYKCSGRVPTLRARRKTFSIDGKRASPYSNGKYGGRQLVRGEDTEIQRWEHRVCAPGSTCEYMAAACWYKVAVPGKTWRNGAQAYAMRKVL